MRKYSIVSVIVASIVFLLTFQNAMVAAIWKEKSGALDEICVIVLVLLGIACVGNVKKIGKFFAVPLVIFIYSVTISLLFGENNSTSDVVVQSFLHLQFILIIVSLAAIYSRYRFPALRILKFITLVSCIGAVIQFLLPELLALIIGETRYIEGPSRFGIFRWEGFQKNPNALGFLLAMCITVYVFHQDIDERSGRNLTLISIAGLIMIFTGSNSSILFTGIALLFFPMRLISKLLLFAILVFSAIQFSQILDMYDKVSTNFANVIYDPKQSGYSRWLMLYNGFKLMVDYFPIGTGVGTFGTAFSRESVVYIELGIQNSPAVYSGRAIQDSNVGAVIGELGFIGVAVLFGYATFIVLKITSQFAYTTIGGVVKSHPYAVAIIAIVIANSFLRTMFLSSYYSVIVAICLLAYLDRADDYK